MQIEKLYNVSYWDDAYNRLINKPYITNEEIDDYFRIKELKRNQLVQDFLNGTIDWGIPRKLRLAKANTTKKRIVYLYSKPIRLLLGVVYRWLSDEFETEVSDNCFSYKKKISTVSAVRYIKDNRDENQTNGVKVDIHAYFNSVCMDRVHEMLDELFVDADVKGVKQSLERLFFTNEVYDDVIKNTVEEWKGLIPGTPIASFFANYCLRELDFYFDTQSCIYARYSDDIIVLDTSKDRLETHLNVIKDYLLKYDLEINPKKYTWFTDEDDITFLGLKLKKDGTVDLSDHSIEKIKKTIYRWCKKARREIEKGNLTFEKASLQINNRLNNKNFKCYIRNEATFGWCHYAFRYITTIESLKLIDYYTRDTLRYLKTGKHNKKNYYSITDDEFKRMKWVSLVELYELYKKDFDYYCEVIELL